MQPTSRSFPANARAGLADPILQQALGLARTGFPQRRLEAIARLPEFEDLREEGRAIKDHTLGHLDFYLELYERNVIASGGHVHWARNAEEARAAILDICRAANAKIVTKGKSMVAEEIALNDHLEQNGITPVETDLGEYIIQLRHEPPSHIIAPAIHLMKEQVADAFRGAHTELDPARPLADPRALCDEARTVLRPRFLAADVGITGANFIVAETGSSIIVTNEGNGDLTQILPRVHIVVTGIEKIVPTLEDAATLLRLLARSATGQEFSSYTTISTGPRRPGDLDGPEEYHVVLVDNGRSALLGGEFHAFEVLERIGQIGLGRGVFAFDFLQRDAQILAPRLDRAQEGRKGQPSDIGIPGALLFARHTVVQVGQLAFQIGAHRFNRSHAPLHLVDAETLQAQ